MTPRTLVAVVFSFIFTVFSVLAIVIIPTTVASANDQISQVQDIPDGKPIKCKSGLQTTEAQKVLADSQPQTAEDHIEHGIDALVEDHCTDAERYFTEALKLAKDPNDTLWALFELTYVAELLGKINEKDGDFLLLIYKYVFRGDRPLQCGCNCRLGTNTGQLRNGKCPCLINCP